jgi:hypothetical protein
MSARFPSTWRRSETATRELVDKKGMDQKAPILVRVFKEESTLEVWKKEKATGRYAHLKDYPICAWSGVLGPKLKEGDKQAPEGFYTIRPAQMNPKSSYHLSFNIGYPNDFDRAHGRTGTHLMVHGACSSAGCYSMTDEQIQEIYTLGRLAFEGGQREFQVQAFPFRMTAANMAKHRDNPNMPFWRNLKEGYAHFEVCGSRRRWTSATSATCSTPCTRNGAAPERVGSMPGAQRAGCDPHRGSSESGPGRRRVHDGWRRSLRPTSSAQRRRRPAAAATSAPVTAAAAPPAPMSKPAAPIALAPTAPSEQTAPVAEASTPGCRRGTFRRVGRKRRAFHPPRAWRQPTSRKPRSQASAGFSRGSSRR